MPNPGTLTEDQRQKIEELRNQHEDVSFIRVKGELIVVRAPSYAESQQYNDTLAKTFVPTKGGRQNASVYAAKRTYVLNCTVLPARREEAAAFLDKYHAAYDKLADKVEALAEAQAEIEDFEGN